MGNKKEILNKSELALIYKLLGEYADNMDELLGDEYAEDLYNIYIKLSKQFGNRDNEDFEEE